MRRLAEKVLAAKPKLDPRPPREELRRAAEAYLKLSDRMAAGRGVNSNAEEKARERLRRALEER